MSSDIASISSALCGLFRTPVPRGFFNDDSPDRMHGLRLFHPFHVCFPLVVSDKAAGSDFHGQQQVQRSAADVEAEPPTEVSTKIDDGKKEARC